MRQPSGGRPAFASLVFFLIGCLFFFLTSTTARAEEAPGGKRTLSYDEIEITGSRVEQTEGVYEVTGDVRIRRGGFEITAERARLEEATGRLEVWGNVLYEDSDLRITASHGSFVIGEGNGYIESAEVFVKKSHAYIRGREIRKLSDTHYTLERAQLTTCDTDPGAWCLEGTDVDMIIGERATARSVAFRVGGFPVFYSPYVWLPIITERNSGLLIPTIAYRETLGLQWRQPYFWAISENRDATLELDYYSKRGTGKGLEYRYEETWGSGSHYLYHMPDSVEDETYFEIRSSHSTRQRHFTAFSDIRYINDRRFLEIYDPYHNIEAQRFLESRAEVYSRLSGGLRPSLEMRYYKDLLPGALENETVQKLPEIAIEKMESPLSGGLDYGGRAALAHFYRPEGPGGLRGTLSGRLGQRLEPFGPGPVVLSHSLEGREALYHLDEGLDTLSLLSLEYSARLEGRIFSDYGKSRHWLLPSLTWSYRHRSGDDPPMLDRVELDEPESEFGAWLETRLSTRERGSWFHGRLGLLQDSRGGEFGRLDLWMDGRLFDFTQTLRYDLVDDRFDRAKSTLTLTLPYLRVSAGQRYTALSDVMLYVGTFDLHPSERYSLESTAWYDDEADEFLSASLGLTYRWQCWSMSIRYIKRPEDYSIFLSLGLKGFGSLEPPHPPG